VRMRLAAALAVGLAAALVARTRAAETVPERLSGTGLFLPGTTTVDPRNQPFSPQYPLWTDGARKARWLYLPAGARIDASRVDAWDFPAGTRLWKEFAFAGRKVETRMLWRAGDGVWHYASYLWNDAQTDATLAPADGVSQAAEVAPGRWHAVPARDDCRTCHENSGSPVLGVSALQLSSDRDPQAPHAEPLEPGMLTNETLAAQGRLAGAPAVLAVQPPRIPGDARTRAALGYLTANCGHCHNDATTIASVRFPLRMPAYATPADLERVVAELTARTTRWDRPHAAPGTTRLVDAGAPDASALVARMRSRRPSSQMPPLGSAIADGDAIDLVSAWIAGLPAR
jgi:cytochrome c553